MNLGSALGLPEDPHVYEPDNRLILPKCRVGVEFEFEGTKMHPPRVPVKLSDIHKEAWASYWNYVHDGSLHDQGCEYSFRQPLFGSDAVKAVIALCNYAKEKKFKTSIRTGLHVHVDVRDLSRVELARLNVLYALFERAVYRLAGHNREENVFCMPWHKSDRIQHAANNINSPNRDIRASSEALEQEKYGGLNLDTLARFGSVEFRHALATTESDWVIKWINVCLAFKRAAQKLDTPPLELIHNMSGVGPDNFARIVFEDMYETIAYPELERDVWRYGIETALEVYPKQQEAIEVANLSWNLLDKPAPKMNERFKSYVDRKKPKEAAPAPYFNIDIEAAEFPEVEDDDD